MKKGNINIRFFASANATVNGATIPASSMFAAASSSGYFLISVIQLMEQQVVVVQANTAKSFVKIDNNFILIKKLNTLNF